MIEIFDLRRLLTRANKLVGAREPSSAEVQFWFDELGGFERRVVEYAFEQWERGDPENIRAPRLIDIRRHCARRADGVMPAPARRTRDERSAGSIASMRAFFYLYRNFPPSEWLNAAQWRCDDPETPRDELPFWRAVLERLEASAASVAVAVDERREVDVDSTFVRIGAAIAL